MYNTFINTSNKLIEKPGTTIHVLSIRSKSRRASLCLTAEAPLGCEIRPWQILDACCGLDDFELSSRAVHFQTRKVSVVRMNAAGLGIVAVELGADMLDVEKHACSIGV